MNSLSTIDKIAKPVSQSSLPVPYNYLLTQPLMTKGIETYYQRRAIIQTIYAKRSGNSYSRVILMLLDKNNVKKKKEALVAELAFISMNFSELPENLIADVLNTNIPFGKLLLTYHVKTASINRSYFAIKCNRLLSSLTHCKLNTKIYGRRNTLIRTDNKRWVAKVVEILPALILS
jgi:hypothetical protein